MKRNLLSLIHIYLQETQDATRASVLKGHDAPMYLLLLDAYGACLGKEMVPYILK
jgi:hypothetical protein